MGNKFKKIYTIMFFLMPILTPYKSFVPRITLAELPIFLLIAVFFLLSGGKWLWDKALFFWFFFLAGMFIIQFSFPHPDITDFLGTTMRYLLTVFLAGCMATNCMDFKCAMRTLRVCAFLSSIYLIAQYLIAQLFSIYLPAGFPFLENYTFREEMYQYVSHATTLGYRPRSVFGEPAHYCQYVNLALMTELYEKAGKGAGRVVCIAVYCVGILCSMSLLGVAVMGFIWIQRFFPNLKKKTHTIRGRSVLLVALAAIVMILIVPNIPQVQRIIENKFNRAGSVFADERFRTLFSFQIKEYTPVSFFFGRGMDNPNLEYCVGPLFLFNSFGVMGICAYLFVMFWTWINSDGFARRTLEVFTLNCIVGEYLTGIWFALYYSVIISSAQRPSKAYRLPVFERNKNSTPSQSLVIKGTRYEAT